jgi:hypothetical protein
MTYLRTTLSLRALFLAVTTSSLYSCLIHLYSVMGPTGSGKSSVCSLRIPKGYFILALATLVHKHHH